MYFFGHYLSLQRCITALNKLLQCLQYLDWHFQGHKNNEHIPYKGRFGQIGWFWNFQNPRDEEPDGWNSE